jgi:hypothetical protein
MTKDILNFLTNLGLGIITDELVHGSPFSDVILEGVDKFAISFHAVDIGYEGLCADKDLGTSRAVIDSGCIRENGIRGYGF